MLVIFCSGVILSLAHVLTSKPNPKDLPLLRANDVASIYDETSAVDCITQRATENSNQPNFFNHSIVRANIEENILMEVQLYILNKYSTCLKESLLIISSYQWKKP